MDMLAGSLRFLISFPQTQTDNAGGLPNLRAGRGNRRGEQKKRLSTKVLAEGTGWEVKKSTEGKKLTDGWLKIDLPDGLAGCGDRRSPELVDAVFAAEVLHALGVHLQQVRRGRLFAPGSP